MPKTLREFERDLCKAADEGDAAELHFLGAIIIQGQQAPPVVAKTYQVIDGQQRLTTIFLYLLGAVKILIQSDKSDIAEKIFRAYIVVNQDTRGKSNIKIHPSGQDRADMNDAIIEVLELKNFRESLTPFNFIKLETSTPNRHSRISKNFKEINKFFRDQFQEAGFERIEKIYSALLQKMTVVQIDIKDALSGPKIFHSLNSKQEPMTVGDLVKNDIFDRGINLSDQEKDFLEKGLWASFYNKFGNVEDGLFDNYFFPYGLVSLNVNIQKSEVYPELRKKWSSEKLSPEQIINNLSTIQDDYLDLCNNSNTCSHDVKLAKAFSDLCKLGIPTTLYPFLIQVSFECREKRLEPEFAIDLIRHTESFLVRRGAIGLEPSGLHAAFKGLWTEIHLDNTPNSKLSTKMLERLKARSTVQWPTTDEFKKSLINRSIYGSRVTPYILVEYNNHFPGDQVDKKGEIEHILPQTLSESWTNDFTEMEHDLFVNVIGNLTLLSSEMNKDISNGPYTKKIIKFSDESMYQMTRNLAKEYLIWDKDSIKRRGTEIADWAAKRWPHG